MYVYKFCAECLRLYKFCVVKINKSFIFYSFHCFLIFLTERIEQSLTRSSLLSPKMKMSVLLHCVVVVALVVQLCPTFCNPMDCSLSGSFVHGILQARILEWVAIPFSRGSSQLEIESRSPVTQTDSSPSESRGRA